MSSITGLNPLNGTSITNSGFIALGTDNNQGTTGQIIRSNGANNPVTWDNETTQTNQKLNIGTNITLTSGNTFYDGSVAETINSTDTDTTYQAGIGVKIDTSTNPDTINAFGGDYFLDYVTGNLYHNLKPSDFVMDDDSGGDNRWVISDGANTEGSAVNRGINATQIYAYFEIPSGYRFSGYRINLNQSTGAPWTTPHSNTFYTRAGYMNNLGSRVWSNTLGGQGYNAHNSLIAGPQNGYGASWQKGDPMYYGIVMAYRLYWTSSYFFPGGYVEFEPI